MSKVIGIAGMGWLGMPLAQRLKLLGFQVKGSVTRLDKASQLQRSGFDVYPMTISEEGVSGSYKAFLKELDILIILIPPGLRRNTGSDYVLKISHLLSEMEAAKIPKCIFISSTSVYGDSQGTVTEKDIPMPESEAGRQLFQVEQLLFNSEVKTTILRFGGLYGGNRQPVKYLAGRENLNGGKAPVNLIHRDDCIAIIFEIIKQDSFGNIFNAVHPEHPMKQDYYTAKASELGLDPPSYVNSEEGEKFKKVDSINLKKLLTYSFSQPL
ncbi:MAG: SDR family oxidoreductase [Flavobacteriaceae bacterium]|nr:SDR family oxidoreductase [Flavobacteriaceae bacterium]